MVGTKLLAEGEPTSAAARAWEERVKRKKAMKTVDMNNCIFLFFGLTDSIQYTL